jgi:hypothetical protein
VPALLVTVVSELPRDSGEGQVPLEPRRAFLERSRENSERDEGTKGVLTLAEDMSRRRDRGGKEEATAAAGQTRCERKTKGRGERRSGRLRGVYSGSLWRVSTAGARSTGTLAGVGGTT